MIPRVWIVGLGLALIVGAGFLGYQRGWSDHEAKTTRADLENLKKLQEQNADLRTMANVAARRLIEQAEALSQKQKELEDAARADPNADRRALGRDSVRRIFSQ